MDRRRYLRTLAAGGLAGTAGCLTAALGDGTAGPRYEGWPMPGYGPDNAARRATGPALDAGLERAWGRTFAPRWSTGSPIVHDGTLFVAEAGEQTIHELFPNKVRAFAVDDGRERWSVSFDRVGGRELAVAGGRVYVGNTAPNWESSRLSALEAEGGGEAWSTTLEAAPAGTPTVAGDTVYVPAGPRLVGVDAATGDRLWTTDLGARTTGRPPAVRDGRVAVGCRDGTVRVVDRASRRIRARHDVGEDVEVVPTAGEAVLVAGTWNRIVGVVDGERRWTFSPATPQTLGQVAVGRGRVYVPAAPARGGPGTVYALAARTGEVDWRASVPPLPVRPTLVGGTLFVPGGAAAAMLDATHGTVRRRQSLAVDPLIYTHAVTARRIYCLSWWGEFGVLEPAVD